MLIRLILQRLHYADQLKRNPKEEEEVCEYTVPRRYLVIVDILRRRSNSFVPQGIIKIEVHVVCTHYGMHMSYKITKIENKKFNAYSINLENQNK